MRFASSFSMAYAIALHSLWQITRNRTEVLALVRRSLILPLAFLAAGIMTEKVINAPLAPLPGMILMLVGILVLSVQFHRYVLIPEADPSPTVGKTLLYLGWLVLISQIAGIAALPATVFVIVVENGDSWLAFLALLVLVTLYGTCILRLSAKPVAVAVGQPLPLRAAWDSTKSVTVPLAILNLGYFAALFGLDQLQEGIRSVFPSTLAQLSSFGLILPALVFILLWQASIVTTIYGHVVEKRPLRA